MLLVDSVKGLGKEAQHNNLTRNIWKTTYTFPVLNVAMSDVLKSFGKMLVYQKNAKKILYEYWYTRQLTCQGRNKSAYVNVTGVITY